ncbi:hypothetical protein ES707_13400 [subsurface metagenome]
MKKPTTKKAARKKKDASSSSDKKPLATSESTERGKAPLHGSPPSAASPEIELFEDTSPGEPGDVRAGGGETEKQPGRDSIDAAREKLRAAGDTAADDLPPIGPPASILASMPAAVFTPPSKIIFIIISRFAGRQWLLEEHEADELAKAVAACANRYLPEICRRQSELSALGLVLFAIIGSRLVMEAAPAEETERPTSPAANVPAGAAPLPEVS